MCNQSVDKFALLSDSVNMMCKNSINCSAYRLRYVLDRLSGPIAFLLSIFWSKFKTLDSVIVISGITT